MKIVLIADDSPVIRKVARRLLEDEGFVACEASDGGRAMEMCIDNMPDAVIVDWDMPGMSGLELVQWLGTFPPAEATKILFCTSEVMVSEMTKAKRAGAHGFLLKPFDKRQLLAKLSEIGLTSDRRNQAA